MARYRFFKLRRFVRRICPFNVKLLCENPCYKCGICEPLTGCMGCIRPALYKQGRCRDIEHR